MDRSLLCISYRFPPQTYPLAIRVKYFLNHLRREGWDIDAVTAAPEATSRENLTVHHVPSWTPERLFRWMRTLRLDKLLDLLVWPDPFVFWGLPAYRKARHLLRTGWHDAIAVFMMPHSQGLVGLLLKRATGLPLILNLNDSLTCSDMNPSYPSRLHYRLARALEDRYVQAADAVVYVSRRNLERVRDRQPPEHHDKFHLIRRGATRPPTPQADASREADFRIVYTGGMGGWYKFLEDEPSPSLPERLHRAWQHFGTYSHADLDYRTHSPVYVGRAVQRVFDRHPEWRGRIQIDVYGPTYPDDVVDAVLDKYDLREIVHLHGPVPHQEALRRMAESDLLFMALPDRPDGSPGGRISAKTYEYLMTDRPILAALPPGENREYLRDKPGVHLAPPDGIDEMADVIADHASSTFAGNSVTVDRSALRSSLSSTARARAFEEVLLDVLADEKPTEDPVPARDA